MTDIFIIGLPQQERSRVESSLLKRQIRAHVIPCDWGGQGRYVLLPHPSFAIHTMWDYCNTVGEGYSDAHIFVLPYAPMPDDLYEELLEMLGMGVDVNFFRQEEDGWPFLRPKQRLNQEMSSLITRLLLAAIGGEEQPEVPSEYIAAVIAECPQLVVVADAIDACDEVSKQRYPFIRESIKALVEVIRQRGNTGGTMEEFFRVRQLYLAQSGGDTIELEVHHNGRQIHKAKSNVHLKKGDATTPQNCPRIYYQGVEHASLYYIFLLYVGPHREGDFSRLHHLQVT